MTKEITVMPLMRTEEVAEILSISKATLEAWRFRGTGPDYVKAGKAVRYRYEDVKKFERENTVVISRKA